MRAFGTVGILAAAALSLSLHLGGIHLLWAEESAQVEGGAPASPARLGNSFQDVAQGIKEPDTVADEIEPDAVEETVEPERGEETKPDRATDVVADNAHASERLQEVEAERPTPLAASEVHDTLAATAPVRLQPEMATPSPVQSADVVKLEPSRSTALTLEATKPADTSPLEASTPAAQQSAEPQKIAALPNPDENETAPQVSARPSGRPKEIEDKAAEVAKARAAEEAARRPERTAQKPKTSQPRGTNQPNQTRGQSGGQANARAAEQSRKQASAARAAGNAAASNYKGIVQRKIARQRQPRVQGKGRVVVGFTIANNGSLSSLSIARSSGRPDLDRVALNIVKRAAPFPKPPPGARRNWQQPITVGR